MKRIFCFIMLCVLAIDVTACNTSDGKDATNEVVNRENGVDSEIKDKKSKDKQNDDKDVENGKFANKDEESPEYIMEYAQANYFNKSRTNVDCFVYYYDGKKYEIDFDSKEGKELYDILRSRFVYVGEYVSKDVNIKNDISNILKENKVLEVRFEKEYVFGTEPHENTDYKSVPINVSSWIFPLEGEYEEYFTYLPGSNYTFEKIDNADELVKYCDKIVK